jgi:hypothetical protein
MGPGGYGDGTENQTGTGLGRWRLKKIKSDAIAKGEMSGPELGRWQPKLNSDEG